MPLSDQNLRSQARHGRGIVLAEANFDQPSKEEKMARRRYQDPKPRREGKWWYVLIWKEVIDKIAGTKRKRKREKLAPATMPEREVRKIAAELLRPLNQGLLTIGSATRLLDYVEDVYRETVLKAMAKSTQGRYNSVLKVYLQPTFGQLCLRDITPRVVQQYFSGMADSKLSHESKDKIRDVLSSVLGSAVKYEYLVKNPVEGVKLPPAKAGKRVKPYLTPEMFEALVVLVREPYATMLFVAIYTGLRVSELIGLRWRNVRADSINIEERCCRGDWGAPKSEASNATIAVNSEVIDRLHRLRSMTVKVKAGRAVRWYPAVKSDGPEDLVFQSVVKGVPMRDNAILVRHIKPAAEKLGIGWVNWQVLRRSYATWLKMVGADVKDAQALMRHSRASTTLDVYQQHVPESQRQVVNELTKLRKLRLVG